MFMNESVRSLKFYFIVIAIFSGLANIAGLIDGVGLIDRGFGILGIFIAVAFFVVGIRLDSLLTHKTHYIFAVLVASAVQLGLSVMLFPSSGVPTPVVAQVVIGGLIIVYLFISVNRLASEKQGEASGDKLDQDGKGAPVIGMFTKVVLVVFAVIVVAVGAIVFWGMSQESSSALVPQHEINEVEILGSWESEENDECYIFNIKYKRNGLKFGDFAYCDDDGVLVKFWFKANWSIDGSNIREEVFDASPELLELLGISLPYISNDIIIVLNPSQLVIFDTRESLELRYRRP